jgi:hypothetical protein
MLDYRDKESDSHIKSNLSISCPRKFSTQVIPEELASMYSEGQVAKLFFDINKIISIGNL